MSVEQSQAVELAFLAGVVMHASALRGVAVDVSQIVSEAVVMHEALDQFPHVADMLPELVHELASREAAGQKRGVIALFDQTSKEVM